MIITLAHGNGGAETGALISNIFLKHFGNPILNSLDDAAVLDACGKIAFTTDSYVVHPLFFPGGDIGRMAVCGTVNDLLTSGATPRYISCSFIIETGMDTETLCCVAASMASAADEAGVAVVTGDTKVVEGSGGLFVNTSGIGELTNTPIRIADGKEGDVVVISGALGNHHACILSARMGIENNIKSDVAPLVGIAAALRDAAIPLHGMRDITRGGLATLLHDVSAACGCGVEINESSLPVDEPVRGLCSILGLDPLFMANEGKLALVVPPEYANAAVRVIRTQPYGEKACAIGKLVPGSGAVLHTVLGGKRSLHPLRGEGLPRIC